MTRENFVFAMDLFKNRRPFEPFTVVLNTGEKLEIDHPEALAQRGGIGIFFAPGDVPILFDHDGVNNVVGDLIEKETV